MNLMESEPSSSPWRLIQEPEADEIGRDEPPSFGAGFHDSSPPRDGPEDLDYEPSVEDEAAWYDRVRLEEGFSARDRFAALDDTESAPDSSLVEGVTSATVRGPSLR